MQAFPIREINVYKQETSYIVLGFKLYRCKNFGLNLRMFLKVQGGLRIKNLKNWLSEMRLAEYVYAANEEN